MGNIKICACDTKTYTKKNVYLCCKSNVTGGQMKCNSNRSQISSGNGATMISKYDCYNTTKWFTAGGHFSEQAALQDMSAYLSTKSCVETCLCINWCITYSGTFYVYMSAEPLSEASLITFKFLKEPNSDGSRKKLVNYTFKQFSTWAYEIDYNAKSFSNINNYLESEGGTGYCTGITNTSGLKLQTLPYPFSNNVSILTTIICSQLQKGTYTTNPKIYRQNVALLTAPFFRTYYINYLKQPVDKTMVHKFGPLLWFNYYTGTGSYNVFLRALDSMIMFIYNVLFTAATQKSIVINDSFTDTFYDLIATKFVPTLSLTTAQVNKAFKNITPELLSQNYDTIFKGWFEAIAKATDNGFILAAQYAPLNSSYLQLLGNDYIEQVLKFVNTATVRQNFGFYRKNAINKTTSFTYQEFKSLPQNKQSAVLKVLSNVPDWSPTTICEEYPGLCSNRVLHPNQTTTNNPNDNPTNGSTTKSSNKPKSSNPKKGKKGGCGCGQKNQV